MSDHIPIPFPTMKLQLEDKSSAYYTTNPVDIAKHLQRFEYNLTNEYCLNLKPRFGLSLTQTDKQYENDPLHHAADGTLLPRPTPPHKTDIPAVSSAQAKWKLRNHQRTTMILLPGQMAQALEGAMGTTLTTEYENSEFHVGPGISAYAQMKQFLVYKFGYQLKHLALATAQAGVRTKLSPGGDIFAHNNQHRHQVRCLTSLRREPQSRLDAFETFVTTLSPHAQAMQTLHQTYYMGVYQEVVNGRPQTFIDPDDRTVESLMRCLELHVRTTSTSAPFAASATTVNPYTMDPMAAYAAGLAAASAAVNPSTMDPATAYAAGLAAGAAQGKAQRPRRNAAAHPLPAAAPAARAAPTVPVPPPPTVPYKPGTLYCYWCGYSVPGRIYHYRAHPPPHTGATCPCATNPTAAQRAAINHNTVAGGKYSSETFARA